MNDKKIKENFIIQAGILAAAGIVTRIIGLLYRSPLHRVIGNLGLGYYSSAYNYYTIILLISSYSIPSAMSKVIAQKLAVEEYRNAHRLFKCALVYVLIVGGAASLFLYSFAGLFVAEEAVPVLRTFAPTIFVYGILGVLRGYFQAHRTMVPTSISQILEQIVNAVVSVGGAYLLITLSFGKLDVPTDQAARIIHGTRGAIGSAIGTGAGVLSALIFMLCVYAVNKKSLDERIRKDTHENVDTYGQIIKVIFFVVTPFILNTAICNLSNTVNNTLYTKIFPSFGGMTASESYYNYSLFSGQASTIANIPTAFSASMAAAMIPTVAQLIAATDIQGAKDKIALAIKTTMLISIPCAAGIFALAQPVTYLLFPTNPEVDLQMAGKLLMALSLSIIFYAYSTLNSQILQGLGRVNIPIVNAGIALIVQTVAAVLCLFVFDAGLYSLVIANTVYSGLLCYLNQRAVRQAVGYTQEFVGTFLRPGIAAVLMGAIARLSFQGFVVLTKSPRVAVFPAVFIGAVSYFVLLILVKGVDETELRSFPKGYLIVRIAKKLHLL